MRARRSSFGAALLMGVLAGCAGGGVRGVPAGSGGTSASDGGTGAKEAGPTEIDLACGKPWCAIALPSGITGALYGVWGTADTDAWIVGDAGTVLHWNGSTWSTSSAPTTKALRGIWGAGTTAVYAVGDDGALLWDGSTWAATAADVGGTARGVWGIGPGDVWVVGGDSSPGISFWDSTGWASQTIESGDFGPTVVSIWGSSRSNAWVGVNNNQMPQWTLAYWNGSVWATVSQQQMGTSFLNSTITSIWGTSESDVWATSQFDVTAPGGTAGTYHFDGTSWSPVSGAYDKPPLWMYGVWGSASNDVWAVGQAGKLQHWNGSAWSAVDSGTTSDLNGVWGSGAGDVWAVGENGTLLHHSP
jgi:hypothetical protein